MSPAQLIQAAKTMHPGLAVMRLEMARRENYSGLHSVRKQFLPGLHKRLTAAQRECLERQDQGTTPLSSVDGGIDDVLAQPGIGPSPSADRAGAA